MKFFPLIIFVFLAVAIVAITLLILEVMKQKSHPSSGRKRAPKQGRSTKIPHEIMVLLQGDRAAAESLIKCAQHCNPNRSYKWCCEKVIHDILRDRRA